MARLLLCVFVLIAALYLGIAMPEQMPRMLARIMMAKEGNDKAAAESALALVAAVTNRHISDVSQALRCSSFKSHDSFRDCMITLWHAGASARIHGKECSTCAFNSRFRHFTTAFEPGCTSRDAFEIHNSNAVDQCINTDPDRP